MSWEVRAPHLEPGAVRPGAEEEGSLHRPHQDDHVALAHLELLGSRHGRSLALQSARSTWAGQLRSCRSSHRFISSPPPYPPSVPSEAITRWHGTTSAIGFLPFAAPTARVAVGWPTTRASSAYDQVVPAGMVRSAAQTRRWNAVPCGSTSRVSIALKSPAKYASS